ncbi:hypothetical protein FQN53_001431 [Emmonsiellopsis sp. PD_33]|nr:hypothetical protein FQN53_001431 [Emmonsiellopsis sp. PD_33]
MPPFLPRKRIGSEEPRPSKRVALGPAAAGPSTRQTVKDLKTEVLDGSESPLSSLSSSSGDEDHQAPSDDDDDDDDDEEEDWEDALQQTTTPTSASLPVTPSPAPALQDLELTLEKHENAFVDVEAPGKKGPSKIEREIRIRTHCMHVQFLLWHNAIRNAWVGDKEVQRILREQVPEGIKGEIEKWEVAVGRKPSRVADGKKDKVGGKKGKGKGKQRERDWGDDSARLEPGQPDMSRGDPTIQLMKVLAAYWRKRFKITAPGLRKMGFRAVSTLKEEIGSFQRDEQGTFQHGERIKDLDEFRELARRAEGSRDVGAQLFTALVRSLGIEARMVANLQPIGFGWTKAEIYRVKEEKPVEDAAVSGTESSEMEDLRSKSKRKSKKARAESKKIDSDLPFPIYWTEAVSPITHEVIPVEALVLPNSVATTPELLGSFEPRGAKAEKAKQVIAYVVAYSPDATAKDVTTRYLKRHTWPGKTKGFRMPVEKIPLHGGRGPTRYFFFDWFKVAMRGYVRPDDKRTVVDEKEDAKDLSPNQPERKVQKEGDTLQSLRASPDFVLERFLRREEAIRPGSKHVRTFVSGRGDKVKEEKVYKRADVEKCLSAESWHKEGRQIKVGETPLKLVPVRAVTLTRKREIEEAERESGEKQKQGLYAFYQTEYIIPPPIQDGIIPKNAYGNIDCFVPTMIPKGATHIPWRGTVRVCKKLGIDYAEAVTGFEFGSKMAVPVIEGVVVASENAELVQDAWRAEDAEKRKKEELKHNKLILSTWRKFIMGLRIAERIQAEYGEVIDVDAEAEEENPFTNNSRRNLPSVGEGGFEDETFADEGGGFLLPDEEAAHYGDMRDDEEPRPPGGTEMEEDGGDEDDL